MTFTATVYPSATEDSLDFSGIDRVSLINDDTYGPAPVFHNDADFVGTVLYINPRNIAALEVTKS